MIKIALVKELNELEKPSCRKLIHFEFTLRGVEFSRAPDSAVQRIGFRKSRIPTQISGPVGSSHPTSASLQGRRTTGLLMNLFKKPGGYSLH